MTKNYSGGPVTSVIGQMEKLEEFKLKKKYQFESLTGREIGVLVQVANGLNNPAIANELGITRATVQNHRASIRQKLDITGEADYIKYAMAFDLLNF